MQKYLLSILLIFSLFISGKSLSFFSSANNGIGYHEYITSVRGLGMGASGLAAPDSVSLNAYNIASWRYMDITRIDVLMRLSYVQTEFPGQSFTTSTGKFSGIQLGIPIKPKSIVFGLSITPYTNVDYSITQKLDSDLGSYQENVFFEGSISRAQVNLTWSPHPKYGFGFGFNYYFGRIRDRYQLTFDTSEDYNTNYVVEYQFRGPGISFSFDWNIIKNLYFGGFVDSKPKLNFTRVINSPLTFLQEKVSEKGKLPVLWGIGASYQLGSRLIVAADYSSQKWSEGFGISAVNTQNLTDWYKTGIGIEHSHENKRTNKFFNKFDIRAGFSAGKIGYLFNNEPVREYSGSLGFGFPFHRNTARLDIAIVGGIRGDKQKNLAQEKFMQIFMSLSAGELWFQKLR